MAHAAEADELLDPCDVRPLGPTAVSPQAHRLSDPVQQGKAHGVHSETLARRAAARVPEKRGTISRNDGLHRWPPQQDGAASFRPVLGGRQLTVCGPAGSSIDSMTA